MVVAVSVVVVVVAAVLVVAVLLSPPLRKEDLSIENPRIDDPPILEVISLAPSENDFEPGMPIPEEDIADEVKPDNPDMSVPSTAPAPIPFMAVDRFHLLAYSGSNRMCRDNSRHPEHTP